ncbi:MAG: corrinoid protein [Eubacterium sp.]
MVIYENLIECLLDGDEESVVKEVTHLHENGVDAEAILTEGLISGMDRVGVLFENDELFLPEMLASASAMKEAVKSLKPYLSEGSTFSAGKIVFATVEGDIHDIGKNLCISMLEGAGFEVIDLGVDVKTETIIHAVFSEKPDILCLSALLALTMPPMRDAIKALEKENARSAVKVIIGGAPITQEYADEIGADGYSDDASGCVTLAKRLLKLA